MSTQNWDDIAESWFALVALYDELRGERARVVLAEILSAKPAPATHAILAQLKARECIRHSI